MEGGVMRLTAMITDGAVVCLVYGILEVVSGIVKG